MNSYLKPFEVKKLEDISFHCTMTYQPGSGQTIDPRLLVFILSIFIVQLILVI